MDGVSWIDRQPSDWLASNGRWYPARHYPNGWSSSALPPAPGHGGANSILEKYASAAAGAIGINRPAQPSPMSQPDVGPSAYAGSSSSSSSEWHDGEPVARPRPSATSTPPTPGFSVARSGRSVADATVTSQKTYANSVGPAAPPPPALTSPPAPGRVRDDAPKAPNAPAAPAQQPEFPVRAASPTPPVPAQTAKTEFEVIAGDLGSVLGSAKKRIEKALNDSFEG